MLQEEELAHVDRVLPEALVLREVGLLVEAELLGQEAQLHQEVEEILDRERAIHISKEVFSSRDYVFILFMYIQSHFGLEFALINICINYHIIILVSLRHDRGKKIDTISKSFLYSNPTFCVIRIPEWFVKFMKFRSFIKTYLSCKFKIQEYSLIERIINK